MLLNLFAKLFHPGVPAGELLLHPVGRAAWVGLFATALNLLPAGQLDGGHILRSISTRFHRLVSTVVPILLLALAIFGHARTWYLWAAILFGLRFLRTPPIYDHTPLDADRRVAAMLALMIFLLCFMPAPIVNI
jgi:membrane-associated protease RseP (regulator of RpoE activity)